jgi:hypothetical protein
MNNFFKCVIAAFIFLSLICHKCYSIDDREKLGSQPPMTPQLQQMQNPQPPSPVLPPAQAILPPTNVQVELPQVPIIGNSLGKVISKGVDKDGFPWIELKDEFFNETLKIKISPKNTPIIKKTTAMNYNDIKIGDTVSVVFNQLDENIMANFVSIFTEEDLKAMEESSKAESSAKTKNETKDNKNSENLKHISE